RDRLIAEHMGVEQQLLTAAIERDGSIAGAIATLTHATRLLAPLAAPELSETTMVLARIGDPGEPVFESMTQRLTPDAGPPQFPINRTIAAVIVIMAIVLALAWTHTPLADYVTRHTALALSQRFAQSRWTPLVVVLAYVPASFIMFPRWIIT